MLFQAVDNDLSSQLGDFQPYARIFLQEAVEKQRQEVRCDGGDDTQPEIPDHFPLTLTHQLTESLDLLQNHACLLNNLHPFDGRYHRHLTAVKELYLQLGLELLDLHTEGGLGDRALRRRSGKV